MTEPKEALKPCPFCDNAALPPWRGGFRFNLSRVLMTGCYGGETHPPITMPVDAWNTRAEAAEIAALREKLAVAREALEYIWETSPNVHDAGRARDALDTLTGGDNAEG